MKGKDDCGGCGKNLQIPGSTAADEQTKIAGRTYWVDARLPEGVAPSLGYLVAVLRRDPEAPKLGSDGSVSATFNGQPHPPINGYEERDGRLVPLWPGCAKRRQGVTIRDDHTIDVVMRCDHPNCSVFGRSPTVDQCLGCPFKASQ